MLNLTKAFTLVLVLLMLPGVTLAQGKIAVLSVQEAIINTDAAQQRLKELRQSEDYVASKKQFDQFKKEGQELVEKLKKDNEVMSPEQIEELRKRINSKRDDLEHVARKLQEAEKDLQQRILVDVAPKVKEIVALMIKNEGIGLLLDRQVAMHVDSSYNITPKVTDKLNQSQSTTP